MKIDRREFLRLATLGSIVFVSGCGRLNQSANAAHPGKDDFFFIQISDTHWGFAGPAINPDATGTLKKAVDAVNNLGQQPDFVTFLLGINDCFGANPEAGMGYVLEVAE